MTFHFAGDVAFASITVHTDDSNGFGGVSPPASIRVQVGALDILTPITDPLGGLPFAVTIPLAGAIDDQVLVTFNHGNEWVFISEVQFDGRLVDPGTPAPAPASLLLLGSALALLGWRRRR